MTVDMIAFSWLIIYLNPIFCWCIANLLFFDISLLYYYANLNSSITCIFSGDIYLSFGISLLPSPFSECIKDFFEEFVILSTILFPIKSPVAFSVFWISLFEAAFIASVVDFLALSRTFWLYLLLKCVPMFLAKR